MPKKSKNDYPFTNWTSYFQVLKACFHPKQDYHLVYPKYFAAFSEINDSIMMQNILALHPTKKWAQEGLDGWIKTCLNGYRYSVNDMDHFEPAIRDLLEKGATIDYQTILTPMTRNDLKKEAGTLAVRAQMLKLFQTCTGLELPSVIKEAIPMYWEDMLEEGGDFMTQFYSGICYELKTDYPFTNWTTYFHALKEHFQGDEYDTMYPKYFAAMEEEEIDNLTIMQNILALQPTKEWAQEGLNGWMKTCIIGQPYSIDMMEYFEPVIHELLEKGATVDVNIILTPMRRKDLEEACIEEECTFVVRAKLLKLFQKCAGIEIPSVIKEATPIDEDFSEVSDDDDYMAQFYSGINYELQEA